MAVLSEEAVAAPGFAWVGRDVKISDTRAGVLRTRGGRAAAAVAGLKLEDRGAAARGGLAFIPEEDVWNGHSRPRSNC